MTTKVKTVSELIFGLVFFNLFFGMAALPGYMVLNNNMFLFLLLLPTVPVYQYLRNKITYMAGIILTHMFIPVVLIFIADFWVTRIIIVGFAILYSIFSISRFNKPQGVLTLGISATSTGVFFTLVIIAFNNELALMMLLYPVLIVISIVLTIIHRIISKADESLSNIRASSAGSTKKIIRFNYILAAGTGTAIILLGLFFFFALVRPMMVTIYDNLPILNREANQREIIYDAPALDLDLDIIMGGGATPFLPGYEEPHRIVQVFLDFLFIIVVILVIVAFIFILFYLIKAIFGFLSSKNKKTSDTAFSGAFEDEKQFIYDRKPIFSRRKRLKDLHPIRRAFYEKILKYKKKGFKFDPSDTPTELAEKITEEDISELVVEYKNIRYGVFE